MSKYFYHATSDLKTLKDILQDGEIKSPRLLGKTIRHDLDNLGLNGLDYISVCNKLDNYDDSYGESSFEQFIRDSFCFIISSDIEILKPTIIDWTDFYQYMAMKKELYNDMNHGLHVSFYIDEYRTKDRITRNNILGVGLPSNINYSKEDLIILRKVLIMINQLHLDVVDSSDKFFIEKYEIGQYNREDIVKKIKGLGL